MANLQPEIPQEIQHGLDHLLAPRRVLAGGQEGDIDIGMRRHFAAAIAAHRHDGQSFTRGAIARWIDGRGDVIVDHAQQLVDEEGLPRGAIMPGGGVLAEAAADLFAAMLKCRAQQLDHARTGIGTPGPRLRGSYGLGNGLAQRAAIDYGALVGNADGRHRGACLRAGFWPYRLSVSSAAA